MSKHNKSELLALRRAAGVTAMAIVGLLEPMYPKIDKTCIAKAESEEYGLVLSPKAMRLLRKTFPQAAKTAAIAVRGRKADRRKADRHKDCHRITVRLTESEYSRLQLHLKDKDCTMQDFFAAAAKETECGM